MEPNSNRGKCETCDRYFFRLSNHYTAYPTHNPIYIPPIIIVENGEQMVLNEQDVSDNENEQHNNDMDNMDDMGDYPLIEENGMDQPPHIPLRYDGKVPDIYVDYHTENPQHICRQSQDTLDGILNPEFRSQRLVDV
jgi:hypothetical protein